MSTELHLKALDWHRQLEPEWIVQINQLTQWAAEPRSQSGLNWDQWLRDELGIIYYRYYRDDNNYPWVCLRFRSEQAALLYRLKY
jgi:hypothetical protein